MRVEESEFRWNTCCVRGGEGGEDECKGTTWVCHSTTLGKWTRICSPNGNCSCSLGCNLDKLLQQGAPLDELLLTAHLRDNPCVNLHEY